MGERPGSRDLVIRARERERQGRLAEAAALWGQLALQRPTGATRAEAFAEQARLLAGPLGQRDEAFAAWRRAFANEPARPDVLEALQREAQRRAQWLLLGAVLRQRFAQASDPTQRGELARALGQLELEQLHAPNAARHWFSTGLENAPAHLPLVVALAELERAQGNTANRLALLERLLEARGSAASVEERLEVAALCSEREEPVRALAHLQRAVEQAPDDARVLEALAGTLAALDHPTELTDVLERLVTVSPEGSPRARWLMQLGRACEERLFDPDAALAAYQRAASADPSPAGAAEAIARLRAKREGIALPATAPEPPADTPLEQLEREVRRTSDRARLALLVREIESTYAGRGRPDGALASVQRWVLLAPEEPEALRALARIHESLGRDAELCATLEALDPLLETSAQAPNRRRIATLYLRRERRDEALRAYERALAAEPRDLESLEAIAGLQRARGDTPQLLRTLWRVAELHDPRRRALCVSEIATLLQEQGDLGAAIDTLLRLEGEVTAPRDVPDRIEALLEQAGRHEELELRLRSRSARYETDSSEAVALELRRARLLLDTLGRSEEAVDAYRNVLRHAPEAPEAKAGLERALRAGFDASALAELLDERSHDETDPELRERSALERGVLLDELLERRDEAREIFRELASHAQDREIRAEAGERYERLLDAAGEWEALRNHLEARLARAEAGAETALHDRLARLCGERLHDRAAELAHWEKVVAQRPDRGEVWHRIAERYEQDDRIEDAIRAMEAELGCSPDATRAQTLHVRLAELALHTQGDEERASAHYERLFELNPAHPSAANFLIERHQRGQRPGEVLRVLEARLATLESRRGDEPNPESLRGHRTALRVHIARVKEQQSDIEGAISALEVALGEEGPIGQVAEPLADCYQQAGYALDLIELCRAAAAASDESAERAAWFVRQGDAFLERERPRDAADAYRQALAERPDDRALQASLRQLYRKLSEPEPLVRLLEAELAHLGGPDEISVRLELAELLASLERHEPALLHARRVLQLAPQHPAAFERALALSLKLEQPEGALEILDTRLADARGDRERADLLARRARLLAGPLGRPDDAVAAYQSALQLDPSARELRNELVAQLERRERWDEVLEWLGCFAREARGAERIGQLERAIGIASDRLGADRALPWLERLRLERPDDARVYARIADVHRRAGRREALLRALEAEASLSSDAARRRDLNLERARLLERTQPARALEAVHAAREAQPADPEVLRQLEDLQRRLGRHSERAATLETLLAAGQEDPVELHCRLAALYDGPLANAPAAVRHWRAALAGVSQGAAARAEILRCLADTWRRAGEHEAWADAAEAELVALRPEPVFDDRRRELRQQLALAWLTELGRPDTALRHLRSLLDSGEDELLGRETVARLERLALRALRTLDLPMELEARTARHLTRCPDDVALWLELARLREERLQAPTAALDAYRRALALDPGCLGALHGLRRVAERLGRWQDVADSLEAELAHPDTQRANDRGALLRRLGDVCWHRLAATTRASRCYAAAIEVNGRDLAALRALERLLEAMEDWRGAMDLYESEIEVLGSADAERQRALWLRVSRLARERSDEIDRARRAYARAAALGELEPAALLEWAELHERAGDRAAFADAFRAWCDATDAPACGRDHLRLAECLAELGRHEDALGRTSIALAADGTLAGAWDLAARLRERLGDRAGSAEALLQAATTQVDDREAARRLLQAAQLFEPIAPERALAALRNATARCPSETQAHAARARLAHAQGLHAEAQEAAGRALDLDGEAQLGAAAAAELALLAGDAARENGRLDAAVGFYERARLLRPDDTRALSRFGETLVGLGDFAAAREILGARLERGDAYPERPMHRVLLGRCFEHLDALEEALGAYESALEEEPRHQDALEAVVKVHQALGHVEAGVAAFERWARRAERPEQRGTRLLQAAEWELRCGGREASAERHLREAVQADPRLARAWQLLVTQLLAASQLDAAIEAADRAASHLEHDADLGALALLQARAFEERGARPDAAEVYQIAAEADPRASEAALAQARLLRGFGAWQQAGDALRSFLSRHPEPRHASLAEVNEQLGRLLAGPLEDVAGAIDAYRRAIALDPERATARAALAELLSHRSGDASEALSHLRPLLAANPADAACLRVALRIARARAADTLPGVVALRALGIASSYELDEAGTAANWRPQREAGLADPHFEVLRQLAHECADALAAVLGPEAPAPDAEAALAAESRSFLEALRRAEAERSVPGLLALSAEEVGSLLQLVASVVLDADAVHGDGRRVNALASALTRRLRKRLRKLLADTPLASIGRTDFAAWRRELRSLAATDVLAAGVGNLRSALVALVQQDGRGPGLEVRDGDDISTRVGAAPFARALLQRIVCGWLAAVGDPR